MGPAIVLACDLPLVSIELVRLLADWEGDRAVVPVVDGQRQPLCSRWSESDLRAACSLAASGQRSLHGLPGAGQCQEIGPEHWGSVVDARAFADTDTPEDLQRLGIEWQMPRDRGRQGGAMKLATNADGLVSVARARLLVHARCRATSWVDVGLGEALGCVTATEVRSASRIPMFDNSAMDGYAVRSADCADAPSRLRVIDRVHGWTSSGPPVGPGQAIRIMTGAPLPEGADAVCALEHTTGEAGSVVVEVPVTPGQHIRRVGEDIDSGDLLVAPGTVLTGLHLGLLASVGCPSVEVHRRPRVAVLSTGDELATPGTTPGPRAEIFDSNRVMLLGHVAAAGRDVWTLEESVTTPCSRRRRSRARPPV